MLKDYLNEKGISIYSLAKKSKTPYSTVNDLANGRVDADSCRFGLMRSLAGALGISSDRLYRVCKETISSRSELYGCNISISVSDKTYFAGFDYGSKAYTVKVCPVNLVNTAMIKAIAQLAVEDCIEEMEAANE